MRIFILGLALAIALISVSSAELLITANPMGKGKWGVLGGYLSDTNALNTSGYTAATLGGYVGYGLADQLDLYINLGQATMAGLPAGVTITQTGYGLTLKQTVLSEGPSLPVSVAVGAGYRLMSTNFTGAVTNGSQSLVGAGISKMMIPFIPYAGLVYRSGQSGGALSSQIDLTVGTALAWSMQGAVYAEYTAQSITAGGVTYSSPQMAISVAYMP